jgi:hypothetical protein
MRPGWVTGFGEVTGMTGARIKEYVGLELGGSSLRIAFAL